MGYKFMETLVPPGFNDDTLRSIIKKKLRLQQFEYYIQRQSLDARQAPRLFWNIRLLIISDELPGENEPQEKLLEIPRIQNDLSVVIVGSGPAGMFCADILSRAGAKVVLVERGRQVKARCADIARFEKMQIFHPDSNYVFGEGGAGTFSDGKLTSRTKGIDIQKKYVFQRYVEFGAPQEILYLSHPHLGTDNLRNIVQQFRRQLIEQGVQLLFETKVIDFRYQSGMWKVETTGGVLECQVLVFAVGHSAYDTLTLLIKRGVQFRAKPFAIGTRIEHPQELINLAMWKQPYVQGLKAAEYFLKWSPPAGQASVYSFCMCPGGKVVQASPAAGLSIVNGMSFYARNSPYANAGLVVAVTPNDFSLNEDEPLSMLEQIQLLEHQAWNVQNSFAVPANTIEAFMNKAIYSHLPSTSYKHGIVPYDFEELLPQKIVQALREAMKYFAKKISGFETGLMLGLETKTSNCIQVLRNADGMAEPFHNLYVAGEASGRAGGIVSSAVDGIKTAFHIIKANS